MYNLYTLYHISVKNLYAYTLDYILTESAFFGILSFHYKASLRRDVKEVEEMNELPQPIKIEEHAAIQDTFLARYVEGVARQQNIAFPGYTSDIAILVVFFEAGSRNRPHTHEHDQTLLVLSGRTMVATETEKYILSAGEVITIPANVWHWHGATHDAPTCQVAIMIPGTSNFEADERNWATNYL